jgi:ABC-2 type transport system permease protein
MRAQGEAVGTTIRIQRFDSVTEGHQAVRDGAIDVLVDGHQLAWRTRADEQLKAVVTGAIQVVAIHERAAAAGIDLDELADLVAPVPVTNVELGLVEGRSRDDETAAMIMSLVLLAAISTYGSMVLTGVVEEKSSRTVEVLLARMPARNLLAGKIIGIGTLGLAQVAATGIVALGAAAAVDSVDVPAVRGDVVVWAVVWFVLGYAIYATLYGTLGSLASRTEDASSVTGPVTVVMVLVMSVAGAAGTYAVVSRIARRARPPTPLGPDRAQTRWSSVPR